MKNVLKNINTSPHLDVHIQDIQNINTSPHLDVFLEFLAAQQTVLYTIAVPHDNRCPATMIRGQFLFIIKRRRLMIGRVFVANSTLNIDITGITNECV